MKEMYEKLPFVSIILPIRNEAGYIERCLKAVLAQDYPPERMEIIIADGMSTDGTREIVYRIIHENPNYLIKMIDNPGKIVPTGMNAGLRSAKGEIIIRVDGHCEIDQGYIQTCVYLLQNIEVDGVGGPIETIGETFTAKVIAICMSSKFGVGNSAFRTVSYNTMLVDTVPFPVYKKTIINKVGLYDEELVRNQDDEYNYRIRELGGKILLSNEIRSKYFSRSSLQKLWRQYFQYGFYKVRVLQKHPRQMQPRQFAPPLFVFSLIVSVLLFLISAFCSLSSHYFYISLSIPALYLIANLSASLYTAAKRGWKYLPLLPLVFAILHISYGLGFLFGLVKFANRWGDKEGKVPILDVND